MLEYGHGRLVLAPMVRVGTLPMRLLALEHGASLVWSPELIDKKLAGCRRFVNARLRTVDYLWHQSWARPGPASDAPNADYDGDSIGGTAPRPLSSNTDSRPEDAQGLGDRLAPNDSAEHRAKRTRTEPKHRTTGDYGEEVPADAALIFRTCAKERGRIVLQIGSACPETALAAARVVAPDVDGIDLNCGCPKPFSTHAGMGAALLSTPDRLVAILAALAAPGALPPHVSVSAKIRLLPTPAETAALARRISDTGVRALTVHCRFVHERPRDAAHYDQLRAVVEAVAPLPVIVNGDMYTVAHARAVMAATGAAAAMFARPAMWDPSIFAQTGGPDGPIDLCTENQTEGESLAITGNGALNVPDCEVGALQSNEPSSRPSFDELLTLSQRYAALCAETDNPFPNTKYVLAQMWSTRPMHTRDTRAVSSAILAAKDSPALHRAIGSSGSAVEHSANA